MNLLVIFIVVLKFIRTLNDLENSSLLFSDVLFGITTSLALAMLFYEKKCLIRTSAPLSLFWPLLTIFYLPTMKLEIEIFQEDYFGATNENNTIFTITFEYSSETLETIICGLNIELVQLLKKTLVFSQIFH